MALNEKYQAIIDIASQNGAGDVAAVEQEGVLYITGTAPSAAIKQQMWDKYNEIDPDYRAGDLVLNIEISGGSYDDYEIKSGDSLSKIASHHATNWKQIWDANRDVIKDPNLIYPGQKIRIPKA